MYLALNGVYDALEIPGEVRDALVFSSPLLS
jgi:hypothetical protein